MGWKLHRTELSGHDCLKPNEERDLSITLRPENRAAIHGVVRFPNGKPAKNAVVKLFKKKCDDPCDLVPITFAFTDHCGQFLFGVPSGIEFVIKVFFYKPEKPHKPTPDKPCHDDCDCDYDYDC